MDARENGPDSSASFHLGYRRWLDGLRGWAIIFVLAFHLGVLPGGSLGVDIFFVLSGFLITTLLVEEWQRRGSISLRHFYLRRALRLFPALFTLLLLYGLIAWWTLPPADAANCYWEIVVAGCYISNWETVHAVNLTGLGHTWSLSVEEQFYLLWPAALCVMLALRLPRRRTVQIVCTGIVACVLLRIGMYQMHRGSPAEKTAAIGRMCVGLDTRADSLLVGCLVGLIVTARPLPQSRRVIRATAAAALVAAAGLAYLAMFSANAEHYFHGLFTVVALMAGAIIVHMLVAPSRLAALLLEGAPVVAVGRISYGLYLYHMVIIHWMWPVQLGWRHPGTMAAIAGLSLAAALVSYYVIERPCLQLKDRFGHRRPAAPAGATHRRGPPHRLWRHVSNVPKWSRHGAPRSSTSATGAGSTACAAGRSCWCSRSTSGCSRAARSASMCSSCSAVFSSPRCSPRNGSGAARLACRASTYGEHCAFGRRSSACCCSTACIAGCFFPRRRRRSTSRKSSSPAAISRTGQGCTRPASRRWGTPGRCRWRSNSICFGHRYCGSCSSSDGRTGGCWRSCASASSRRLRCGSCCTTCIACRGRTRTPTSCACTWASTRVPTACSSAAGSASAPRGIACPRHAAPSAGWEDWRRHRH